MSRVHERVDLFTQLCFAAAAQPFQPLTGIKNFRGALSTEELHEFAGQHLTRT